MLPSGRRLAIDYGEVRVGTALSDVSGILASPYKTFPTADAIIQLVELAVSEDIAVVYLGLPLNLSGAAGQATEKAVHFGTQLRAALNSRVLIHLIDERLSTKSAAQKMANLGEVVGKNKIDQLAAAEILEFALQIEKSQGELAGRELQN